VPATRVQSAAAETANVHRSREPAGDERAAAQNCDQDGSVQKKIFQRLRVNSASREATTTRELPNVCFDEPARVHTLP